MFAPPFPKHLSAPGFWDESYFADIRLTRLFTALFSNNAGQPVKFHTELVEWRPDRAIFDHRANEYYVREHRCVTESNAWVSELELLEGEGPLDVFLWALPDMREPGYGAPWQSLTSVSVLPDSLAYRFETAWPSELEPDRTAVEDERARSGSGGMLDPLALHIQLGASAPRLSHTVNLAQRHDDSPLWETSLLPQKLKGGRLPGDEKVFVGPPPREGMVHLVQQYSLVKGQPLVLACGVGVSSEAARAALEDGLTNPIERSTQAWQTYFTSVPQFSSSDPYLTNAYWYRWYGLRLNTVDVEGLGFAPFVTEGIGFFRNFVTYSAQAHLREAAWMHDPKLALGILENLKKCQREDGSFPGHNYSCRPARDFYHADFATGTKLLMALHSTVSIDREPLQSYAAYLKRERSIGKNMTAIFDQNETGQEYMSRYQAVSENADQWGSFLVGGTDATTYHAILNRFLQNDDTRAEAALSFVSCDDEEGFFCDVLPDGMKSSARPATGLYPLLALPRLRTWQERTTDRLDFAILKLLNRWLLNEEEFWLPKGFPATAKSDPTFSSDAEWKDKRLNCPWNGRSWPMANSHIVDALAKVARTYDPNIELLTEQEMSARELDIRLTEIAKSDPSARRVEEDAFANIRQKAGEALMKAIMLMFHDGDPSRPNSYEHYDPITGTPSLYRGYDDYMHSWIVDLILRHAVGVRPGEDGIDPLPLNVDWIECTDIPHPKGRLHIRIENNEVTRLEIT